MAVNGDIREITYSHPTIGSGAFKTKSNESNTFDPGGFRTNDDANQVTSDGTMMQQKNRVLGFLEVVCENDMDVRLDVQKVQELSADSVQADWTFTMNNGSVYKGKGTPVGDIQADTNTGTFTLKVNGAGFEKQ